MIAIIMFYNKKELFEKKFIFKLILFGIGFVILIIPFEIISRIGKTSYIMSVVWVQKTINGGDYSEGYTFIPEYLYKVEGLMGLIGGLCYITSFIIILIKIFRKGIKLNIIEYIIFVSFLGIIFHSSQCYFLRKLVWYGRLFHFYYLFIVISIAYLIFEQLKNIKLRKYLQIFILAISVFSFFNFFRQYIKIGYPKDILYYMKINTAILPSENKLVDIEIKPSHYDVVDNPSVINNNYYNKNKDYTLVNFAFLWPQIDDNPKIKNLDLNNNLKCIYKSKYYLGYTPYLYEGFDIYQRNYFEIVQPEIKVYKNY